MKFAATIWISYTFQIQKRIFSAKTIWGNTVSYDLNFTRVDTKIVSISIFFFYIEKVKSRERNTIHNTTHDLFPSNGHISVFHHFSTVTRTRLKMAHRYILYMKNHSSLLFLTSVDSKGKSKYKFDKPLNFLSGLTADLTIFTVAIR